MKSASAIIILLLLITLSFSTVASAQWVSPGKLTSSHSKLEGIANCFKCHSLTQKISDFSCNECHDALTARINEKKGYHARVKGPCTKCHTDHKGTDYDITGLDKDNFNHDKTGYELRGKHILRCYKCHKKEKTYLDLSPECLNCHTDVHMKTLPESCGQCHNSQNWKDLEFNHKKNSAYALTGEHRDVECDRCHPRYTVEGTAAGVKKVYEMLKFKPIEYGRCSDCHIDVHLGKLNDKSCKSCHSTKGWKETLLNHSDPLSVAYALSGKHKKAACKLCHPEETRVFTRDNKEIMIVTIKIKPIKFETCTDCHFDVHKGQFKKQLCDKCHSMDNEWAKTIFNHDSRDYTGYKLEGKHRDAACDKCHEPGTVVFNEFNENKEIKVGRFKPIKSVKCNDCHYDIHKGQFNKQKCTDCHSVNNDWKKTDFDHQANKYRGYKLTGKHLTVECNKCHIPAAVRYVQFNVEKESRVGIFKPLKSKKCDDCHFDVHEGQFRKQLCTDCHSLENNWKETTFDHQSAKYKGFKLNGKHKDVLCEKCHELSNIKYVEFSAEKEVKLGRFKPVNSEHCNDCHFDVHNNQLNNQVCEACHSVTDEWRDNKFDHQAESYKGYKLEGKHKDVLCEKCHERLEVKYVEFKVQKKALVGQFNPLDPQGCGDCHKSEHKGKFREIEKVEGIICEDCHTLDKEWQDYIYTHKPDSQYKKYNPEGQIKESKCEECHMCTSDVFCISCCFKSMGLMPAR